MTTAAPLARYGAMRKAPVASGSATAELHHLLGHDPTGAAFKPLAGIEASKLSLRRGEQEALRYGDKRGYDLHCRACGSLLYSLVREGRYVHVAMGTLVDDPAIRPPMHIFVGSKAPWFEITDQLPQYDGFPDHG